MYTHRLFNYFSLIEMPAAKDFPGSSKIIINQQEYKKVTSIKV